ncbi:MAG: NAD(P)/FAD-dependent oxidoreductase [Telmatospirillum sp.]|nr:NAD(P)/FAD-dependent oxidoreductase [Telmatospirillum sp.]
MTDGIDSYDVAVVGSGIGGLAAAALLARFGGRRVCLVEQHSTVGGLTQTFRRPGGWEWDAGVHYVGEMAEGRWPRRLMDAITGHSVDWLRLPEPADLFLYPDLEFASGGGETGLTTRLKALFPEDVAAIDAYFSDVRTVARSVGSALLEPRLPPPVRGLLRGLGVLPDWTRTESTGDYLARRFCNPRLRGLLASIWGDYGVPPSRSAFPLHAAVVAHYLDGAWYPRGGGSALAKGALTVIGNAGGRILRRHRVTQIRLEKGRVAGIDAVTRIAGQDRRVAIPAPLVISDAGAENTYRHLLAPEAGARMADRLAPFIEPCSGLSVYLGLNGSPRDLGFTGGNVWLFDSFDHDAILRQPDRTCPSAPTVVFLSFPTLRSGERKRHTAEIVSFLSADVFAPWHDRPWRRRGRDYEALKDRLADALIARIEARYPGFAGMISYREVSTPLSVGHFIASPRGAIYGLTGTVERYRALGLLGVRTAIPGLLLTGADAFVPGVAGAAFAGAAAAGAAMGPFGFVRLMGRIARETDCPL